MSVYLCVCLYVFKGDVNESAIVLPFVGGWHNARGCGSVKSQDMSSQNIEMLKAHFCLKYLI